MNHLPVNSQTPLHHDIPSSGEDREIIPLKFNVRASDQAISPSIGDASVGNGAMIDVSINFSKMELEKIDFLANTLDDLIEGDSETVPTIPLQNFTAADLTAYASMRTDSSQCSMADKCRALQVAHFIGDTDFQQTHHFQTIMDAFVAGDNDTQQALSALESEENPAIITQITDAQGRSALDQALEQGDLQKIERCLANGFDRSVHMSGFTRLIQCLENADQKNHPTQTKAFFVKALVEESLIQRTLWRYTADGSTPLHFVAQAGNDDLVKVYVNAYLNDPDMLNQQDMAGNTALHYAVANGFSAAAARLVEAGAATDIKNNRDANALSGIRGNRTPLQLAKKQNEMKDILTGRLQLDDVVQDNAPYDVQPYRKESFDWKMAAEFFNHCKEALAGTNEYHEIT